MSGDNQHPSAKDNVQWQYKTETPQNTAPAPEQSFAAPAGPAEVEWTASEFVSHNKGAGWYSLLAVSTVVLSALVYLLTRDTVSVGIIIFVAVLLGISAARKPRVLNYAVDRSGLVIGEKHYPYSEFKSFSVMQEGAFSSIVFMPLKRFMPTISIYYDPADEEHIVEVLSYYLPLEARSHDVIDRLISRIRF